MAQGTCEIDFGPRLFFSKLTSLSLQNQIHIRNQRRDLRLTNILSALTTPYSNNRGIEKIVESFKN